VAKLHFYKIKKAFCGYPAGTVVQFCEGDARELARLGLVEKLKAVKPRAKRGK